MLQFINKRVKVNSLMIQEIYRPISNRWASKSNMVNKSNSTILLKSSTVKDALTSTEVNGQTPPKELGQQWKYLARQASQTSIKTIPNNLVKLSEWREKTLQSNFIFQRSKSTVNNSQKCPENFGSFIEKLSLQKSELCKSKQVKTPSQLGQQSSQQKVNAKF